MNNIFGVTRKKLESYFESIGEKKFKATQVFEWLYIHKIWDVTKFSNIKKEIQEKYLMEEEKKITPALKYNIFKCFLFLGKFS